MKILHIISGLGNGGAESTLHNLIMNDYHNKHIVISLSSKDFYKDRLVKKKVEVFCIDFKIKSNFIRNIFRLFYQIIVNKPNAIQTWMYHGNIIGGLSAILCLKKNIIWNIRNSNLNKSIKFNTKISLILNIIFSYIIPKKIIYCSKKSIDYHQQIGINKKKTILIYNGYKFTRNLNDHSINKIFYKKKSNIINLGLVSRWDPVKNHTNAIKLICALNKIKDFEFKFYFAGEDINYRNKDLTTIIQKYDLKEKIVLCGDINNIYEFYSFIDINFLFSKSESFPNVLAEAMLSGIPCISTNVGDAEIILNNLGWLFNYNDEKIFLKCVNEAVNEYRLKDQWDQRKLLCKNYILKKFNIENMVNSYNSTWKM